MIYEFYTGSYALENEPGILLFRLDTDKNTLEKQNSFSGIYHPSYLCLDEKRNRLYAVQEQGPEGMVHELRITENGPEPVMALSSGGADPCHLSLDSEKNALYVANYTSGSLISYELEETGALKKQRDFHQHEGTGANPVRQECAHVHFAKEHENLLYVSDLGQDQVFVYEKGTHVGTLRDTGRRLRLPAGYGPRHLEFDPDRPDIIYVLCELAGKIVVFKKENQDYIIVQEVDTLPEGFKGVNISAAIKRSGDLLFASNRGHDSIASFRIQEDGSLKAVGTFPSGGKTPRDFEIFGCFLVVANQDSDSLTVLKLDKSQGTLSLTDLQVKLIKPCCICFAGSSGILH